MQKNAIFPDDPAYAELAGYIHSDNDKGVLSFDDNAVKIERQEALKRREACEEEETDFLMVDELLKELGINPCETVNEPDIYTTTEQFGRL